MQSGSRKSFYYYAGASSLGGVIEKPFQKIISPHASVSLPPVGGYATNRAEHFNFEEIVSARSGYARVSGSQAQHDGPWSVLVTSVVEDLNLLEVVTAARVVAQISVDYPREGGYPRVSLAGSHFEGLRLGGVAVDPKLDARLLQPERGNDASQSHLTYPIFQQTGRAQAEKLFEAARSDNEEGPKWLLERFQWMSGDQSTKQGAPALCSVVENLDSSFPGRSYGHVVEIPDFGRIFLGEILITSASIDLTMIRAELGCAIKAQLSVGHGGVGGHTVPPS